MLTTLASSPRLTLPNPNSAMALNPNYDAIGKAFVQQYYALFDDKNARPNLVNLYNVSLQIYKNDFLGEN